MMDQSANSRHISDYPSSPPRIYPRTPELIADTDFSLDRLPTLSAAEALQGLRADCKKPISTGLRDLDALLQGKEHDKVSQEGADGGLGRGQVAEIWGSAGVGKTAFA